MIAGFAIGWYRQTLQQLSCQANITHTRRIQRFLGNNESDEEEELKESFNCSCSTSYFGCCGYERRVIARLVGAVVSFFQ